MASVIETYGWNEHWEKVWESGEYAGLLPARVIARWRDRWEVACAEGILPSGLAGRFRRVQQEDAYPEVGDFVGVRVEQGSAMIAALLPRVTVLQRHMAFTVSGRQALAANVDLAFAAMALDHDFSIRRMERYLTAIAGSGVKPVALLTKTDLCPEYWAKAYNLKDSFPGLETFPVCAPTGEGLEEVRRMLAPGKTSVILGSSGVGKSTLLNALYGIDVMRTGGLRSDGMRGAHTTTNRQMLLLADGALFIDTPGMREFGVVGESEGIGEAFRDIDELAGGCRFRDCLHENEPGCAVRKAVNEGRLDPKRLKSYRSIEKEMEREAAKAEYRMKYLQKDERRTKREAAMSKE